VTRRNRSPPRLSPRTSERVLRTSTDPSMHRWGR
jgi:hypothetical protein